jgi:diacylglycerol O-acyltransferase
MSIGIYSYVGDITFGINADFDAFPDVEVLASGIRAGMDELLELAGTPEESPTPGRRRRTSTRTTGTPTRSSTRSSRSAKSSS